MPSPKSHIFYLSRDELALLGVTMIWGTTFLIIRNALTDGGPLFFVATRFACAALIMIIISLPVLRGLNLQDIVAGCIIGVSLFAGYTLQTLGLQTISASKSAFITAFFVPTVPLLQWLLMRRRPHLMAWLGIAFAFVGLILLAGPHEASLGVKRGELYTFLGAVAIAFEVVLIGMFAGKVNVRRVTIVQVSVTSLLALLFMPITGESVPAFSWVFILSACGLGVASALIQSVMNWAQKTVLPTRATVIYAAEPVWAGLFGRIAGERLPAIAIVGGILIVLGVLVSELRFGNKKRPLR